jgi:hypothetical protein
VSNGTEIRAYANCDDAYVAWSVPAAIPNCRGFALWRRRHDQAEEPIDTWVPWAGAPEPEPGHHEPSTVWPIQRLMWSDFAVRSGDVVSYRAVPMIGQAGDLKAKEDLATDWSDEIRVGPAADPGLSAWFNRGVLATQALARRLGASQEPWTKQLTQIMATPGDPIRDYLSGDLRPALLSLLGEVEQDGGSIRAALFELNDPELIAALIRLKGRAEVILANGTHPDDENKDARQALHDGNVTVYDRMTGSRLAHNKFLVRRGADGEATAVWTGSTNWTMTGLSTQVNNGLLVSDKGVAAFYDAEWQALRDAGSEFPPSLVDDNGHPREVDFTPPTGAPPPSPPPPVHASGWFTPVKDYVDLADARKRIDAAKDGILFLAFNPGRSDTLIHDAMAHETTDGTGLYIHGVLNQDPEAAGDAATAGVSLIHRGQLDEADPDIVLPAAADKGASLAGSTRSAPTTSSWSTARSSSSTPSERSRSS